MNQPILQANSKPVAANPANPANVPQKRVTEATRVPMNLPEQQLAMPEIPGYFLYWHLGKNVPRAFKAGYEFVEPEEVDVVNTGLADDAGASGNSDLGSRVSVIAGGIAEGSTEPQRLYLMKLRSEWHEQDLAKLEATNERIAATLRGGQPIGEGRPSETAADVGKRYLKKGQDLFYPKGQRS